MTRLIQYSSRILNAGRGMSLNITINQPHVWRREWLRQLHHLQLGDHGLDRHRAGRSWPVVPAGCFGASSIGLASFRRINVGGTFRPTGQASFPRCSSSHRR